MSLRTGRRWGEVLLMLFTLGNGILYIRVVPPWQSPDEPTHFEYALALARGETPWAPRPRPDLQKKIIASLDRHHYWRYVGVSRPDPLPRSFAGTPFLRDAPSQLQKNPPLYYLLASLVLRIHPSLTLEGSMYRLRGLSLIFTLLTVALIFACARLVSSADYFFSFTAAAVTACLPQFMVIGTSVSPDPLTNLFGTVAIYFSIRLLLFRPRGEVIRLFLVTAAGLMVSYKFFIIIPAVVGVGVISSWPGKDKRSRFFLGGVLFLLLSLLSYCALIRFFPSLVSLFIRRLAIFHRTLTGYMRGDVIFPAGYWSWFNRELFNSFWLKFGWLRFELDPAWYLILQVISFSAAVGLVLSLLIKKWDRRALPGRIIWMLVIFLLLALGGYYLYWGLRGTDTTVQGRHLFLAIAAGAILFVQGWRELFPRPWREKAELGLLLGMAVLNGVSLFAYIMPTFSD